MYDNIWYDSFPENMDKDEKYYKRRKLQPQSSTNFSRRTAFMDTSGNEETPSNIVERHSYLVGNGTLDSKGRLADRTKTGGWKAAPIISGAELGERVGSLGLQRNLVTYFVRKLHISNPKAANMVSNFNGALYLTPIFGGFLADAYFGRFWTIVIFALVQVLGMILMTLSAALPSLKPSSCSPDPAQICQPAQGMHLAVVYIGIYLIAIGNGGLKVNISSLGADQFDETDTREKGQMSHFFNWYYFCVSIGSLISVTVIVYLEDNIGFGWGFGIPTAVLIFAIIFFVSGARIYRFKSPSGSPLTSISQVLVAAFRKRHLQLPANEGLFYETCSNEGDGNQRLIRSKHFQFLDKAALRLPSGYEKESITDESWWICSVTQVEELKMLLSLLPIWASTCFVWTALSQMETFSVEEAGTMNGHMGTHFKYPPASLAVFELVNVLLLLPVYDQYFVPFMRRFTGHPQGISTLQRMGTGIVFSILAMVVAGLVEVKRVSVARSHGLLDKPGVTVPMSIFWLVPQYFLRGTTEIFTQVGQLDFFYSEAPESMRSLGTAMYLSTIGVGHFLSTLLVTLVRWVTGSGDQHGWLVNNLNRSRLDKFYYLLAILSSVNFLFYLISARWYKYKRLVPAGLMKSEGPSPPHEL